MSVRNAIKRIDEQIAYLESGKPVEIAVRSVMADMAVRIFEDGLDSSGSKIGTYNSKDELYVKPSVLPRNVAPRGKPGKERNVQSRKTTYFKSYKDLRSEVGRESGFINLRLTNDLQSDWANARVRDGVAKTPNPTRVSNHEYRITLKRQVNIDKKRGLEKRFGPIFKLTKQEEQNYARYLRKELILNAA